jgi:voltage-gated potassium channel
VSYLRKKIYQVVEVAEGTGLLGKVYDCAMIAVIAASLVPLAFKQEPRALIVVDHIAQAVFIVDYLLRWVTADLHLGKPGAGAFLRYPFTPFAVIDLLSIVPLLFGWTRGLELLRLLRVLRAVRVFRVFKALRYSKSLHIIGAVFRKQRTPLLAVAFLAAGYVLFSAMLIFHVEPEAFATFFDAVYWATTSMATMGYGDIVAVTVVGRIVTMASSVFGLAIIALPAGIISVGYMQEVEKSKEDN